MGEPQNGKSASAATNAMRSDKNAHREHLTRDVISNQTSSNGSPVQFGDMMLSSQVLRGLHEMGITHPSPVQLRVIPIARFGADVVAQAKAGTGKTVVFAVVLLECVLSAQTEIKSSGTTIPPPLGLVLAPTRELVSQIHSVIMRIGAQVRDLRCTPCVGGLPFAQDVEALGHGAHIVVGTPGRVRQLMEKGVLETSGLDVVVLDEADKLLQDEFWGVSSFILEALPVRKQVLAVSATMSAQARDRIDLFTRDLQVITADGESFDDVDDEEEQHKNSNNDTSVGRNKKSGARADLAWTVLLGVEHYVLQVDEQVQSAQQTQSLFDRKTEALLNLLQTMSFQQCIVFCNQRTRAGALVESLGEIGLSSDLIAGDLPQTQRNDVMAKMRAQTIKVMVSTDLVSRGVDLPSVQLVIMLDIPFDAETLFHRAGRTGRFGTRGMSIAILGDTETISFMKMCVTAGIEPKAWGATPVNPSTSATVCLEQTDTELDGVVEQQDVDQTQQQQQQQQQQQSQQQQQQQQQQQSQPQPQSQQPQQQQQPRTKKYTDDVECDTHDKLINAGVARTNVASLGIGGHYLAWVEQCSRLPQLDWSDPTFSVKLSKTVAQPIAQRSRRRQRRDNRAKAIAAEQQVQVVVKDTPAIAQNYIAWLRDGGQEEPIRPWQ